MENESQPKYMSQDLFTWATGSCLYLSEAENETTKLYDAGKVHTPYFSNLWTYERKYVIHQMAKGGY